MYSEVDLDHIREWLDFEGDAWISYKRASELLRTHFKGGFFTVRGGFADGEPEDDAVSLRKLFIAIEEIGGPDVLIVARDEDRGDRRAGLLQVMKFAHWSFGIAGAFAKPEVEAWLICSASPTEDRHRECLAELREHIGFDPIAQSHQLSSTSTSSRRDAKRIRRRMDEAGFDMQESFKARSVDELRQRGAQNGLAAYLGDLDAVLGPLLGSPR